MRPITNAVLCLAMLLSGSVFARDAEQVVMPIDPLSVYVRTTYPESMTTVREAAEYILEPTGYRLVVSRTASPTAAQLASRPIPPIARLNRTMPIVDALQILIGLDHWVIIDSAHKLVTFQETAP